MSHSSVPVNWMPLIIGFIAGFLSRIISLKTGRSHFPGYPSGYISQLTLAVIAALIGSSIIVSLVAKQFTAATFLTLAATQFRDLRKTERTTLEKEEELILVSRGAGYIEGIAITFEARNFLALLVALAASLVTEFLGFLPGIAAGVVFIVVGEWFMSGPKMGSLVDVRPAKISFQKTSLMYAGEVMIMEIGLEAARQLYLERGMAVTIHPKNPRGQAALWNIAQRQAITHAVASAVGVQKDAGYPLQTPICRMELPNATGAAGLTILPLTYDMDQIIHAVKNTPVLESGKWTHVPNQARPQPQNNKGAH